MMFGLDESFDYLECSKCGCLQIKEIPQDMGKYYPYKNYYSFEKNNLNFLKNKMTTKIYEYYLFRNSFLGKILSKYYPNDFFSILGDLKLNRNSKILDVGCGSGEFLYSLNELNFKKLLGIDPYLTKEVHGKKMSIIKKNINQLSKNKKFDFIFFKHSFEHIANPLETLNQVENHMCKNGKCIISIPLKTNYIWNTYGVNWVQIDAPRHLFLYTEKSFKVLLDKTTLKLQKKVFNSNEFQFWGSEQYKNKIYLESFISYKNNPKKSIFSKKQIERFKTKARELNKNEEGDQAIFILELDNET
jgi:2-polyprenyl-3-methyl-5-hydroxy-6-metoxy-1,4-benzoquinol methylase